MSGVVPRPGDRVRVNFDTTAADSSEDPYMVNVVVAGQYGDDRVVSVPSYAVEVLERADDPAKDPVGTVRRSPDGVVAAKSPNPDYPWRGFCEPCGENFATVSVIGWEVIGSVPGTPAAEAAKTADEYPDVSGGGVPYPDTDRACVCQHAAHRPGERCPVLLCGQHEFRPQEGSSQTLKVIRNVESCCDSPKATVDSGDPEENSKTCGTCGADMPEDLVEALRNGEEWSL